MSKLKDEMEAYIPGHGVTTVGEIRASVFVTDEERDTIRYWSWVATNPQGRVSEWQKQRENSGLTTLEKRALAG
jgi:hypothetical protein